MIKQLTSFLHYSIFAEISLLIFAAIFLAIVIRTLLLKSETANQQARIVLGDSVESAKSK